MTKIRAYQFLTLFLFSSCASLIAWNTEKETVRLKEKNLTLKCSQAQKTMALCESNLLAQNFLELISKNSKLKKLLPIDRFVLWSLLQMKARPDIVTPQSEFYVFISKPLEKPKYFSFSSQIKYSMLEGLSYLLKKNGSRYTVKQLAQLLDRYYRQKIFVTKGLEQSIKTFSPDIIKDDRAKKYYLKSDQALVEGETLPKMELAQNLPKNKRLKIEKPEQHLFKYSHQENVEIYCNKDLKLYDHSLFLISPKVQSEWSYSYIDSSGETFQAVSSASPSGPTKGSLFFKVATSSRPPTFCSLINQENQISLSLLSTQSRDSAQHIHHLINYGLGRAKNIHDLFKLLQLPRHIFLVRPIRIIVESNKASSIHMDALHSLDFPIYHKENLGRLEGAAFQKEKLPILIEGGRPGGRVQCLK